MSNVLSSIKLAISLRSSCDIRSCVGVSKPSMVWSPKWSSVSSSSFSVLSTIVLAASNLTGRVIGTLNSGESGEELNSVLSSKPSFSAFISLSNNSIWRSNFLYSSFFWSSEIRVDSLVRNFSSRILIFDSCSPKSLRNTESSSFCFFGVG